MTSRIRSSMDFFKILTYSVLVCFFYSSCLTRNLALLAGFNTIYWYYWAVAYLLDHPICGQPSCRRAIMWSTRSVDVWCGHYTGGRFPSSVAQSTLNDPEQLPPVNCATSSVRCRVWRHACGHHHRSVTAATWRQHLRIIGSSFATVEPPSTSVETYTPKKQMRRSQQNRVFQSSGKIWTGRARTLKFHDWKMTDKCRNDLQKK